MRAQGKPGAGGTRNTVCGRRATQDAHGFHRYSQDIPAFPAQWLDGLLRALPGERPLLPPLPRRHGAARMDARVAAPGPPDFAGRRPCFVRHANMPTQANVPSQPAPTSRDDAQRPLFEGTGWPEDSSDLRNSQEGILKIRIAACILRLVTNFWPALLFAVVLAVVLVTVRGTRNRGAR